MLWNSRGVELEQVYNKLLYVQWRFLGSCVVFFRVGGTCSISAAASSFSCHRRRHKRRDTSRCLIVPIVAVSILVCCCSYLKVPAVGHFSLKDIKQSLCKKIKRENTKKLSLNKKRNTTLHTFKLFSVIYIFFGCTISAGANTVNTVNNEHCSLSPNLILKYPNLSIIILGIKSKETIILYILYILIC